MVCGFATVMVSLADPDVELEPVLAVTRVQVRMARDAARSTVGQGSGRVVTVPCAFDGPDLEEVAARRRLLARRGGRAHDGASR